MMKCPNCGSENAAGAKFCTECGAVLPVVQQQAPQPAAPQAPAYQQPAQQPPAYQQPAPQQPYSPQTPAGQQYAQNVPPKKRSAAPVIAVVAAVAVLAILAVILVPRLLKAKSPAGVGRETTDAVSGLVTDAVATTKDEPATTAAAPETTTEMHGAPDNDLTVLFGDWSDGAARELYITGDGRFFYMEPSGFSSGYVKRENGAYGLSLDSGEKLDGDAYLSVTGEKEAEFCSGGYRIPMTQFRFDEVYPAGERLIWAAWEKDAPHYDSYEIAEIDSSEYAARMILMTDFPVTDVKILALELEDVAQDGTLSFRTRELYSLPALLRTSPLMLTVLMEGSIPTRGISYTDPGGYTYRYTISVSGMDGSLILSPF